MTAETGWMLRLGEVDDADLDALLAGRTPIGLEDLAPIADFAAALQMGAHEQAEPAMNAALVALLEGSTSVPVRPAAFRGVRPAVAAAVLAALGTAAAQNALPVAVQRIVSDVANVVGIDVPSPDGDVEGDWLRIDHDRASRLGVGAAGEDSDDASPGKADEAATKKSDPPEGSDGDDAALEDELTDEEREDKEKRGAPVTPATPAAPGYEDGPTTPAVPATPPPDSSGRDDKRNGEAAQPSSATSPNPAAAKAKDGSRS